VIFENDRVRVLEYRDLPGEKTNQHRHPAFVPYALGPFARTITLPDGKVLKREFKAGDVLWSDARTHVGTNVGQTPTHVVMVEFKVDAPGMPRKPWPRSRQRRPTEGWRFGRTGFPSRFVPPKGDGKPEILSSSGCPIRISDPEVRHVTARRLFLFLRRGVRHALVEPAKLHLAAGLSREQTCVLFGRALVFLAPLVTGDLACFAGLRVAGSSQQHQRRRKNQNPHLSPLDSAGPLSQPIVRG
jgi:hypothetical protein